MKDYTDFEMTGLPDSPVIRKAHALLLRTLEREFNGEAMEPVDIRQQNPHMDMDDDLADSAAIYYKAVMPELARVYLATAVETARIVYANSAFDSEDLVASALLLDCVEDERAIDDIITEMDETAGIPILELDQLAPDYDSPIDAAAQADMSDAAKLLVLASTIQSMNQMTRELELRGQNLPMEQSEWRLNIDGAGKLAADMYAVGEALGGIDAGLDHAFEQSRSALADNLLSDNRNFFADARERIKKAAGAAKPA